LTITIVRGTSGRRAWPTVKEMRKSEKKGQRIKKLQDMWVEVAGTHLPVLGEKVRASNKKGGCLGRLVTVEW